MSTQEYLALVGVVVAAIVALVVLMLKFTEDPHEVYDPGDGSVKVRCPEVAHTSVLFGWGESLRCPSCGAKLDPPTKRMTWQKR